MLPKGGKGARYEYEGRRNLSEKGKCGLVGYHCSPYPDSVCCTYVPNPNVAEFVPWNQPQRHFVSFYMQSTCVDHPQRHNLLIRPLIGQ